MSHPQTAAVFISTFPVTDKKQIGEQGREKESRGDKKKAESEEKRANVEGPTVRVWKYSTCSLDKEWEKKNLASFLSSPRSPPVMGRVQCFWAPAV